MCWLKFLARNVLLLLAIAGCGGCALAADFFDFIAPRTFSTGGRYPQGIAVADFNRDGKLDAAVSNASGYNRDSVGILLGNGDGTFRAPATYPVTSPLGAIVAGDFNNDGYPDVAAMENGGIQVLLNQGNGTFEEGSLISGDWSNIVVADFNGDGNLDLAVFLLDQCNSSVTVLLGNGDGTFQSGIDSQSGSCNAAFAVGDFNHDGKPDLAMANSADYSQGANQLSILIGKGDGTFMAPVNYPAAGVPALVAVADFNRDGKADIALLNGETNNSTSVEVFLGKGDGTMGQGRSFHADQTHSISYSYPSGFVASDFNGDGRLSVATTDLHGLFVLLGDGKGGLQRPTHYAICCGASLVADRLTGNRQQQLLTTSNSPESLSVLLNNAHGTFDAPIAYRSAPGFYAQLAIGDFNGDRAEDLFVTHDPFNINSSDIKVAVLPGNGSGKFGSPVITRVPVGGVRQLPIFAATGDFNGDGKLDAAITVTTEYGQYGEVRILLGKGNGTFRIGAAYPLNFSGFGPIVVGNFNRDGKPDLAVACGNGVCILLGKGNGEFKLPRKYAIDAVAASWALVVGDFNNDGKLDIAATSSCYDHACGALAFLFGNGDGMFGSPTVYDDNKNPTAIAAGDFNSDGNLDLAVVDDDTDAGRYEGYVLLGDGNGNFKKTKNFAVGPGPVSLAAADFNHDGKLDLAVGDKGDFAGLGYLEVLHGKGDGTFELRITYAVNPPVPMVVGNFKHNGGPDLAGISLEGATVYLNSHTR